MKMTCNEAVVRLVDYLHDELDPTDNTKVNEHIENCRNCCGKFEFEEKLSKIVKERSCSDNTPLHLRSKVLDCLRKTM